jgi:hypothetical protein
MIQVAIFGFHLLGDQPTWLRTLSGSLFAAGTVYFVFLPIRARLWRAGRGAAWPYFAAAAGVQLALQLLLRLDAARAAPVVEFIALAGVALLCTLAAISVTLVAVSALGRRNPG